MSVTNIDLGEGGVYWRPLRGQKGAIIVLLAGRGVQRGDGGRGSAPVIMYS